MVVGVFFIGFILVSLLYFEPGLKRPFSFFSNEKSSPGDWLSDQQIKVLQNMVVIQQEDVILSSFADTNSMDPLLDSEANGLEIKPEKDKLQVGDVISYQSDLLGGTVIHRIVEIGQDEKGTYYYTQGDNNKYIQDPEKVRFEQIEGVLIGVLY
jgi:hypothetical protein